MGRSMKIGWENKREEKGRKEIKGTEEQKNGAQ
jgi:hypothetical protein